MLSITKFALALTGVHCVCASLGGDDTFERFRREGAAKFFEANREAIAASHSRGANIPRSPEMGSGAIAAGLPRDREPLVANFSRDFPRPAGPPFNSEPDAPEPSSNSPPSPLEDPECPSLERIQQLCKRHIEWEQYSKHTGRELEEKFNKGIEKSPSKMKKRTKQWEKNMKKMAKKYKKQIDEGTLTYDQCKAIHKGFFKKGGSNNFSMFMMITLILVAVIGAGVVGFMMCKGKQDSAESSEDSQY